MKTNDVIFLSEAIPDWNLPKHSRGVIVSAFHGTEHSPEPSSGYEVEFRDKQGGVIALVPIRADQIQIDASLDGGNGVLVVQATVQPLGPVGA